MPSIREIRQRIRSVNNIAKITKAMQMVASSKMRRAQERVEQARPYAEQLRELTARLAAVAAASGEVSTDLALLKERPIHHIGVIIISPDRGLSGALPSNINRFAAQTATQAQKEYFEQVRSQSVSFVAVGRKGRDFVTHSGENLIAEFTNYGDRPTLSDAASIAKVAVDAFLQGEVDIVYLVYAKFINTVTQTPTAIQLLPVKPPERQDNEKETIDYIYEPDANKIFEQLLPRYVDTLVYQSLLETVASQQSAQMVAMKNATDNANQLVQDLNLTYNKARQTAITTQIIEVVAGAEAL